MKAAGEGKPSSADAPMTVSQLGALIDGAVRSIPSPLRVVGEISGFRDRTHWYFDLKDANAAVACVVFASTANRLRLTPENGLEVVVSGRLDYFAKGAKLSLIATSLEPVGAGALELAYRKLVDDLRARGWFDEARKRPVPPFPTRIGVVTSRTGAALQDVLDTARRRAPWVAWTVCDVRVQGDRASGEIASAIRMFNTRAHELGIDAILVTRGGGSMEDLWAFNEAPVYGAIFASELPVICAIGHETDTTIAELVSDLRCATPTQAAMRLTPDASALQRQLDTQGRRLHGSIADVMEDLGARLHRASTRRPLRDPRSVVAIAGERLDARAGALRGAVRARLGSAQSRLAGAMQQIEAHRPDSRRARLEARLSMLERRLQVAGARIGVMDLAPVARRLSRVTSRDLADQRQRLDSLARQLESVGPPSVLARGYSMTLAGGRIVRSASDVSPGQLVTTRVMEGEFRSRVESAESLPQLQRRVPIRPRNRRGDSPDQLDLFAKGG